MFRNVITVAALMSASTYLPNAKGINPDSDLIFYTADDAIYYTATD